ncbi:MAG: hypothetical protein Kow0069_12100 [Promethearchaeota archaeon]
MRIEIDETLANRFKGLRMVGAVLRGVDAREVDDGDFADFSMGVYGKIRDRFPDAESLTSDPLVRLYRSFLWSELKLDPTKVRPACEALLRRILAGEGLPRINPVVDAYNLASALTRFPMCAYDLAKLDGDVLRLRFAEEGERFQGLGMAKPRVMSSNEIVVCDEEGPVGIYPYRDGERAKVTSDSRDVVLTVDGVPGIFAMDLLRGLKVCVSFVRKFVGGTPATLW